MHSPSHPGRILAYYLGERSVSKVAIELGVTRPALSRILKGKIRVSADMASRLAAVFKTESDLWQRLQYQHDQSRITNH